MNGEGAGGAPERTPPLQDTRPRDEPLVAVLKRLAVQLPETPLLALGQTVFWDEPMKAIVALALREARVPNPLVVGVHDTDYFSRPHATLSAAEPFLILPHSAGVTRDLWCAAAELSTLFGAETVPNRETLRDAGVRLHVAARSCGESVLALLDRTTQAWGWRGIAHTSGSDLLTAEAPLATIFPYVERLLEWGIRGTLASLCSCTQPQQARGAARQLREVVTEAARTAETGSTLSDLYQAVLPSMHQFVSFGQIRPNLTTHSVAESRFGPDTAARRRFQIVDLFLSPASREACLAAYNNAVRGSDIFSMDRFGDGAIPFDLVTPETGRGGLRILDEGFYVDGRESVFVPTPKRIESVGQFAEAVSNRFGPDVHLVGKAITWIILLASDYIFVFHEGASGYSPRAHQLLQELRAAGFPVSLNPILRVRYHTWDALQNVAAGFCLPDHYAEAFGSSEISASEFASRWREVMGAQQALLHELGTLRSTTELLRFLEERSSLKWADLRAEYDNLRNRVHSANRHVPASRRRLAELKNERYRCGIQIDTLQKERGQLRKRSADGVEAERRNIDMEIASLRSRRLDLQRLESEIKDAAGAPRNRPEYQVDLGRMRRIEADAEMERLRIAVRAYLVSHSLEHIDRRPTAWWLPLVSPDGAWFQEIQRTATAWLEPL